MPVPRTVDDYLADLPDERRVVMLALRRTISEAAPAAEERIAYGMPASYLQGTFLVSYAAYKRHYSLFPATGEVQVVLGDEIAPYIAGKGTIRFPASDPVPMDLVARIVDILTQELAKPGA
jgi:uncharacterized protein YdhG (YjbR/CyaY superfamily)